MSNSKKPQAPGLQYSPESRNYIAGSVGDSLNESLNRASALSGITRTKPTNSKPAALPPSPPKRNKPKDD